MEKSSSNSFSHDGLGIAGNALQSRLNLAGIVLNGSNPWDIQVRNKSMFSRVLLGGSLALGETYVEGQWDADQPDELIHRLLCSPLGARNNYLSHRLSRLASYLFNLQKKSRAFQVGESHYDLGNDIYQAMLDKNMAYTCAYWRNARNLDQAQEDKLELVCRKLELKPGMRVLDIGCGWGSFAKYAAERYGVHVVGITVSREQVALGEKRCQGLPVEFRLQDYRDVDEKFDAVVSLGMFEHVGHKNYRVFMKILKRCLKHESLALLHTIGKNDSALGVDPWISRYIFPNGEIPSLKQISEAMEKPRLVIEDVHNFGPDYDRTLMAWYHNFDRNWYSLKHNYSESFYRMWSYYLRICAGAFRARDLQLWQFVISKGNSTSAYRRPFV